jgi:hypothetical protein
MRITTVVFSHVRDCPHWADGDCLHDDTPKAPFGGCEINELATPPAHCPCKDVKGD